MHHSQELSFNRTSAARRTQAAAVMAGTSSIAIGVTFARVGVRQLIFSRARPDGRVLMNSARARHLGVSGSHSVRLAGRHHRGPPRRRGLEDAGLPVQKKTSAGPEALLPGARPHLRATRIKTKTGPQHAGPAKGRQRPARGRLSTRERELVEPLGARADALGVRLES